jgi:hypothetical protein
MSQSGDFDERALIGRAPFSEMVAVRERTPVLALMDAGNDLAAALDRGAVSEQSVEQLVRAWERALFAVARDFGHETGEARA